jgi:copper ion binding protein
VEVDMTKVVYSVPSISCGHCVHTIEQEVSQLAGVSKVKADQGSKQVVVEFDAPATEQTIQSLMAEINYPVAA